MIRQLLVVFHAVRKIEGKILCCETISEKSVYQKGLAYKCLLCHKIYSINSGDSTLSYRTKLHRNKKHGESQNMYHIRRFTNTNKPSTKNWHNEQVSKLLLKWIWCTQQPLQIVNFEGFTKFLNC